MYHVEPGSDLYVSHVASGQRGCDIILGPVMLLVVTGCPRAVFAQRGVSCIAELHLELT